MRFEKEIRLVRNHKAMRTKPWVARVDLEKSELEFLKATEYVGTYIRVYEFENNNFYIICSDNSSHKNKHVTYTLYFAKDNELKEIASIEFTNFPRFYAIDDEVKQILKRAYNSANSNKTVTALIEVAKYYATKHNIIKVSVEEQIRQEIEMICKKYNIKVEELINIAKSLC